jgi:hypothetical protein
VGSVIGASQDDSVYEPSYSLPQRRIDKRRAYPEREQPDDRPRLAYSISAQKQSATAT